MARSAFLQLERNYAEEISVNKKTDWMKTTQAWNNKIVAEILSLSFSFMVFKCEILHDTRFFFYKHCVFLSELQYA